MIHIIHIIQLEYITKLAPGIRIVSVIIHTNLQGFFHVFCAYVFLLLCESATSIDSR